jgi:hypothetical protein
VALFDHGNSSSCLTVQSPYTVSVNIFAGVFSLVYKDLGVLVLPEAGVGANSLYRGWGRGTVNHIVSSSMPSKLRLVI